MDRCIDPDCRRGLDSHIHCYSAEILSMNSDNVKIVSSSDIAKHPHTSLAAEDYIWTDERIERILLKPTPHERARLKYGIETGCVSRERVEHVYLKISVAKWEAITMSLSKVLAVVKEVT